MAQVGNPAGKREEKEKGGGNRFAVRRDFQRQCQSGRHAGDEEETASVEAGNLAVHVGHDGDGEKDAEDAKGDVDEENPVPARVLHEVATDERAEDGADERRGDGVVDGGNQPLFFIDFENGETRHGHDDGATHALDDARTDKHRQVGGNGAEQRAEHENNKRDDEGLFRAEAVGEVAARRNEQGDGEGVGDDG